MYTAIQARNIANEKYNHDYYKLYRWYVATTMRRITRAAKHGYTQTDFVIENTKRTNMNVLRQIAQELAAYGYKTDVRVEASQDNKRKYGVLEVRWDDQD